MTNITIFISFVLTCLTAINTALNPSKRAGHHKSAAGEYNNLKNDVRLFREIELIEVTLSENDLKEKIKSFSDRRNQLNISSLRYRDGHTKKHNQMLIMVFLNTPSTRKRNERSILFGYYIQKCYLEG